MTQPYCSIIHRMSIALSLVAGVVSLTAEPNHALAQLEPQQAAPVQIRSRLNGMVLDIAGGNRQPGAPIIAYPPKQTGSENQLWEMVPVRHNSVMIRSRLNGFVLDVRGGNRAPGAEIIAYPAKAQANENQLWDVVPAPNGAVFIRSRMHGLVLDIKGGNPAPGSAIIAWPANPQGSPNQLWDVVPVQPVFTPPPPHHPHHHQPPPPPPPPVKQAREAGPIWNNGDANGKCPAVCAPPASWSGGWWTTVPNRMSVCECLVPVAYQPPPPPPPPQIITKEAGPIWNNGDANGKCPAVCAPNMRWTGQWRTTVPNRMSVCECSNP